VPRARLVVLAGAFSACDRCVPDLRAISIDEEYNAKVWEAAFSELGPHASFAFVNHFLHYAVRVFFLDLHQHGAAYAERYARYRRTASDLPALERVLPDDLTQAGEVQAPYYEWMAILQSKLRLTAHDSLHVRQCRQGLDAFRQRADRAAPEEANAIEAVLIYYFLFAAARKGQRSPNDEEGEGGPVPGKSDASPRLSHMSAQSMAATLGIAVEDAAIPALVNKAFRAKALAMHPDKWRHLSEADQEGKLEAFKQLSRARDALVGKGALPYEEQ
jgi:hypothetical protein